MEKVDRVCGSDEWQGQAYGPVIVFPEKTFRVYPA